MNSTAILLIVISLVVLGLSFLSWRLISSKSVMFNGVIGSSAILFASHFAAVHDARNLPLTYIIPFVVAMAFVGRGIGLTMRVKREAELLVPSYYLYSAGAASLAGAAFAYLAFR